MHNSDKIKIIITDDSLHFKKGLQHLLSAFGKFEIIATYSNGKELVEADMVGKADLLLTDIDMPILDGIEAGKRVNFRYHSLPMIALTMHLEEVFLEEIIGAGYRGFVYKPDISKELIKVIDRVLQNKFSFPEYLIHRVKQR